MEKENFVKLSIFFTWINVLHVYVRVAKIFRFQAPWNNTEKVILIKLLVVYIRSLKVWYNLLNTAHFMQKSVDYL